MPFKVFFLHQLWWCLLFIGFKDLVMMLGKWCSLIYVDKEIDHLGKTCYIYCWLYGLDGRESLFFGTSSPSWCNVFFYLIKVFMLSIKKKKKNLFVYYTTVITYLYSNPKLNRHNLVSFSFSVSELLPFSIS